MRDERRFVNIKPEKKNLPACRGSASGAGAPVTVASHMTWCCSDHSGRQIQCTVVVGFQVRDFFGNLKASTIRERITLNHFQFQFKIPGDGVILCPSYYTDRTFINK